MNHTKEDQVKEGNSVIPANDAMQVACRLASFMRDTVMNATFSALIRQGLLKAETVDSPEFREQFIKHYDEMVDVCANANPSLAGEGVGQ